MTKTLHFAVVSLLVASIHVTAQNGSAGISFEMPLKTVIIKDPNASDVVKFLSESSMVKFWVYKAGSTEDVKKVMDTFKGDKDVKSFTEGQSNGDYKEFTLELSAKKSKDWYKEHFKKAGLKTIKVNSGPVTEVDKI
jgi:hypothetical protein